MKQCFCIHLPEVDFSVNARRSQSKRDNKTEKSIIIIFSMSCKYVTSKVAVEWRQLSESSCHVHAQAICFRNSIDVFVTSFCVTCLSYNQYYNHLLLCCSFLFLYLIVKILVDKMFYDTKYNWWEKINKFEHNHIYVTFYV